MDHFIKTTYMKSHTRKFLLAVIMLLVVGFVYAYAQYTHIATYNPDTANSDIRSTAPDMPNLEEKNGKNSAKLNSGSASIDETYIYHIVGKVKSIEINNSGQKVSQVTQEKMDTIRPYLRNIPVPLVSYILNATFS